MLSTRRFLALVLIGFGIALAASCSLITDVDRSKIAGTGGTTGNDDAGFTGGESSTGGGATTDAGDADASD
jgi:hypothetical protein